VHPNNWRIVSNAFLFLAFVSFLVAGYSFGSAIYNNVKARQLESPSGRLSFEQQMKSLGEGINSAMSASWYEWRGLAWSVLCVFFMLVAIGCEGVYRIDDAAKRMSAAIVQPPVWKAPDLQYEIDQDLPHEQEHLPPMQHLTANPSLPMPSPLPSNSGSKIKTKCIQCGKIVVGGRDWARRVANCPHCHALVKFS
jgi:hypothetical protein